MSDALSTLAPKEAVPHFKSAVPLSQLGLGPEEGFVLSRVDGATRLGELINLVPFPPERTVEILRRLWLAGAIEIPGHTPPVMSVKVEKPAAPPPAAAPAAPATKPASPAPASPAAQAPPVAPPPATPAPVARASGTAIPAQAVPAGIELSLEQIHSIDTMFGELQTRNAFEMLGLVRGADKKDIKRAYFKLSKEFHPDRYYGKSLGPYADRLAQIFHAVKSSFELLTDDDRRAAYEDSLSGA